jgi:hypothetical protein
MWIKKTSEELLTERCLRSVGAVACATMSMFLVCLYGIPHAQLHIPAYVRVSGVIAAGILLWTWHRRQLGRSAQSAILVCEHCGAVKVNGRDKTCGCGTKMLSMCELKWIETPPATGVVPAERAISTEISASSRIEELHCLAPH